MCVYISRIYIARRRIGDNESIQSDGERELTRGEKKIQPLLLDETTREHRGESSSSEKRFF